MPGYSRHPLVGYLVAALATASVVVVRLIVPTAIGDRVLYLPFIMPVVLAGYLGGLGPGLFATALGVVTIDYFLLPPAYSFGFENTGDLVALILYALCGATVSALCDGLHSARRRLDEERLHLLSSDEFHRLISDLTADFAWMARVDASGRVVLETITDGFNKLLGFSTDQWRSTGWRLALHPDERPKARQMQEQLLAGQAVEGESRLVAKDGRVLWVNYLTRPIRDERGRVIRFVGAAQDITERKKAEQRLAAKDAVTRVLSEADTLEDAAPKVLEAAGECLGWDVGALWLVDSVSDHLHSAAFWCSPWAKAPAFEILTRQTIFPRGLGLPGRVWQSGQPIWIPDVVKDANFPRAKTANSEGLHAAFGFPVMLGGEVLGVVEFFSRQVQQPDAEILQMIGNTGAQLGQFISRKQAEHALREREHRFVRFAQHLPGLLWIKDLAGRYIYVNDATAKIFGRPLADLYGKTDDELFPAETAAQFMTNDRRALASGAGVQVVETLQHEDGVVHSSIVSKFPIPDAEGRPAFVGGMAIDITEQKRAESALLEADRRKDEFLATMAHELRNPLAPIRHALEILKAEKLPDRDLAYSRDVIDRQIQQMVRLLDDLLDVSRISRNKLELHKQPVKLATTIENAFETSQPLIVAGQHQFSVSMPAETVHLDADPVRLAQIFANLLNNAAKYTEPGGQISLIAAREGSDVVVRVRDTGIGIAADMLPRLFEMFSQATPALARSQGGLGIGLALVKGLVELHGGTIDAKSAGPGQGSEFIVRLPVMVQLPPLEPPVDLGAVGSALCDVPPNEKKCCILIADDNRDGADSLARMLRIIGFETHTVYDGQQAVEKAETLRPDVILLDIGMPRMNGHQAAEHIRRQQWGKDSLLIALTGWGREEDRRRTHEAGFDHHLVKPVDAKALLALLSELPVG